MEDPEKKKEEVKRSTLQTAKDWGGTSTSAPTQVQSDYHVVFLLKLYIENPVPPALLATFIFAQHARPLQGVPMIFPPLLLFSTYLNLQGYKIDSAGTTAALSGTYLMLAGRRRMGFVSKFGARGILRGATMGLCLANLVGGGIAYAFGSRSKEDDERGM